MRKLCLSLSFLLAALVVAPSANAQGGLKLNQTYRDVIQLDFPAGQTQIPLPEGEWELLGVEESQSSLVTRIWRFYLGHIENATLYDQIVIYMNHDLPAGAGWAASDHCYRDYVEVISNRDRDVDCWGIRFVKIRKNNRWPEGRLQMHDTLLSRGVSIPERMARVVYVRRNSDNLLDLIYYFHRYPPAKPSITRERLKSWARDWKPKVDAGFLGELKEFKAKEALAPVKQSPKTSLGEENSRLSRSEVLLLLVGNTEIGILKRPSNPEIEGNPDQAYKAFYRDFNTVWYTLDDSDEIERWVWKVNWNTGVLCRGPSFSQTWCRAIVPDGAGGYEAVGFRTGNLRYKFHIEKGLFGLPDNLLK